MTHSFHGSSVVNLSKHWTHTLLTNGNFMWIVISQTLVVWATTILSGKEGNFSSFPRNRRLLNKLHSEIKEKVRAISASKEKQSFLWKGFCEIFIRGIGWIEGWVGELKDKDYEGRKKHGGCSKKRRIKIKKKHKSGCFIPTGRIQFQDFRQCFFV